MDDELIRMQDQYQGLPMEQLIGGPLTAISDGQMMLAGATRDYIEAVGLDEDKKVRMIEFRFKRPVEKSQKDGSVVHAVQELEVSVPFLSIVSVPTLQVNNAKIDFTMEVKSSYSQKTDEKTQSNKHTMSQQTAAKKKNTRTVLSGSVTKHKADNAATFQVSLEATQAPPPEGLSRLLDILHRSIAPVPVGEPQELESKE